MRGPAELARSVARGLGFGLVALGLGAPGHAAVPDAPSRGTYDITIQRGFLAMPDGVRLAVTYWKPVAKAAGERFPALLELLPYRKDDSFYLRDPPLHAYFARHGFVSAKVDVRGTGGSEGAVPDREYSDAELADAEEIIRQLAARDDANGKVGMWGISWGGFNALQVAMRKPPALGAIVALHASDDLYHDDVRFMDGTLHVDPYDLQIDHENGLPRTPDYALDEDYFENRFDAYPWLLTYLRQPVDGEFWRRKSLRFMDAPLEVPAYLIGGLLDGYRDTVPRLLERSGGPLLADIGPWNHAWPDNGEPGPNYEWRARAVRFFDHFLRGEDNGILDGPRLTLFVRDAHLPDAALKHTPGSWRGLDWPAPGLTWRVLRPTGGHDLEPVRAAQTITPAPGTGPGAASGGGAGPSVHALRYVPGYGTTAGIWWGETTGDMRDDDAGGLVYDGSPLAETLPLVGFPRVRLRVSADAPVAHWSARLEDVHPDGRVSLVTGAAMHSAERTSRLAPTPLEPGRWYDLVFDLHFTTWTFRPGHRIRLAVSNAQFPLAWPTPRAMTTRLEVDSDTTVLALPVAPVDAYPVPDLPAPEPREKAPRARELAGPPQALEIVHDALGGRRSIEWRTGWAFEITRDGGPEPTHYTERTRYEVSDSDPADARFLGEASHRIALPGRELGLDTTIEIRSDAGAFHVLVRRRLTVNGAQVRVREWNEALPRGIH